MLTKLTSASGIISILFSLPGIIYAISMHCFAKAYVSDKLGDPTPRQQEKLTLNPLTHIDIIGFICMMLCGFGWGKPVHTNSAFYENRKKGEILVACSGSIALLVSCFVFVFIYYLLYFTANFALGLSTILTNFLVPIFEYAAMYSIFLGFFYMLPFPGFEGFELLSNLLPSSCSSFLYKMQKYSIWIYLGFILLLNISIINDVVFWIPNTIFSLFNVFWGLIF